MNCPSLEQLALYHTDPSASPDRERLRVHVEHCDACRRELAALAATARLLEALPAPPPPDLWPAVAARLNAKPRRLAAAWWKTLAGASLAVFLLGGVATRLVQSPLLPTAPASASPYVARHEFLAANEPLADRAGVGVMLITQQETP